MFISKSSCCLLLSSNAVVIDVVVVVIVFVGADRNPLLNIQFIEGTFMYLFN